MLGRNESPHEWRERRSTNDEGRLGFPRRPCERSDEERLDRLVATFPIGGHAVHKTSQIPELSELSEATCRARERAPQRDAARLLGAWLIAMERH